MKKSIGLIAGIAMLILSTVAQARMYNAATGRWMSRDPIGEGGNAVIAATVPDPYIVQPTPQTNLYQFVRNNPVNYVDPLGLFGMSIGFEGSAAGLGVGGTAGVYGNFSHDDKMPWYRGWSSSVTVVAGGGAAASVYGLGGGVDFGANNSCNVKQLNGGFYNAGRAGLGYYSVGGYRSPDGSVSGGSITVGPSFGYIGGVAGGTNTWTLGGGNW